MKHLLNTCQFWLHLLCAGMTITSCTADKDYFDPNAIAQQAKADYEATFKSLFGEINSVGSWDLTTRSVTLPTQEQFNSFWSSDLTKVDPAISRDLANLMLEYYLNYEGYNNEDKGSSFTWVVPNNDFSIQPVFLGYNGCGFNLWMTVQTENDTQEYLLTSKDDGTVKVKRTANSSLSLPGTEGTTLGEKDAFNNKVTIDGKTYKVFNPAYEIQSKTITFKQGSLPVGAKITFRSEATKSGQKYNYSSTSTEHKEFILVDNINVPESMKSVDGQYAILACEAGADWDLNDVIFLVSGKPYVPQASVIENKTREENENVSKRYMVEDLGAAQASDIDFNDLVFDIQETTKVTYSAEVVDGKYDKEHEVETSRELESQILTIQALGGTKDITLKIGGQVVFQKSASDLNVGTMYNTGMGKTIDPIVIDLAEFGNPWIAGQNNIQVIVTDANEGIQEPNAAHWEINFPVNGTVPAIIAVNTNHNWNAEKESVFKEGSNLNLKKLIAE
ncbi:MAG: hypothetical protein MJZ73_10675 [Bacteroidaceae bacterium]|nr:hypothetical protein [Bacteroidaceae bacterium]